MAITYHAGRRIQGLDSEKPIDASTTEFYDQAIGNGSLDLYTDIPRLGVKAVSGNGTGHINKIKVWLRVIGTHTSTNPVYARVRKISDDSIVATATKTIADLTSGTTITEYEFDFGSCVEITSAEHYVLIEYAYGDASNYLGLTRYSGAVTGWEWTSYNGSSYTTNSTQSLSGTFSNNTWYHVVMTFGSNTVKLYINGSQEDTATFSNPNTNASNGNFVIGRHSTDPSSYGYYDGLLDDTGIWNRVLTSSEVTSLYNSGTGALASSISTTDFAGYYNYDAVTGDKLENQIITASKKGTTTKTFDHSGDSSLSVRSVSNSTNWWEAPRQGLLIEAGHSAVGTYVKKISLPLSKTGIPTGNYTFAIRDSSETIKGSATGVANDLTTSYVITEVTLNTAVLIAVGDHITIEYNDTIPATGKLNFPTSSISGWISGTDQQNWINSAWQGDGDGAGAGRVWQFTFDSTPASFEEFWQELNEGEESLSNMGVNM